LDACIPLDRLLAVPLHRMHTLENQDALCKSDNLKVAISAGDFYWTDIYTE